MSSLAGALELRGTSSARVAKGVEGDALAQGHGLLDGCGGGRESEERAHLIDTEPEVAGLGEALLPELVLLNLEAALEDLECLIATDGAGHGDLLVTAYRTVDGIKRDQWDVSVWGWGCQGIV